MNGIVDLSMRMQCVTAACDLKFKLFISNCPLSSVTLQKFIHSLLILSVCVSCVHNVVCVM